MYTTTAPTILSFPRFYSLYSLDLQRSECGVVLVDVGSGPRNDKDRPVDRDRDVTAGAGHQCPMGNGLVFEVSFALNPKERASQVEWSTYKIHHGPGKQNWHLKLIPGRSKVPSHHRISGSIHCKDGGQRRLYLFFFLLGQASQQFVEPLQTLRFTPRAGRRSMESRVKKSRDANQQHHFLPPRIPCPFCDFAIRRGIWKIRRQTGPRAMDLCLLFCC